MFRHLLRRKQQLLLQQQHHLCIALKCNEETAALSTTKPYFLQNPYIKSFSGISSNIVRVETSDKSDSFTVSYLINSCGLSETAALSASKKLKLETTEKADSVLTFFKSHGFTEADITNVITKCPSFLASNLDKTLKPKIDFFNDLGISGRNLAKIICANPYLLRRSLENNTMPSIDFLKGYLHTNNNIIASLKCTSRILQLGLQKLMAPNITILQQYGVPQERISKLIMTYPRSLMVNADRFSEAVMEVKKMGCDPKKLTFVLAIAMMVMLSKSTWEAKMQVFKSVGWSEDEIFSAFKLQPMCMSKSEKKIRSVVDYLVHNMSWTPSFISTIPYVFNLSLENRIRPRCEVLQILMSKDLIKKDSNIAWVLKLTDKVFLERYVIKNQRLVPELLRLYECNVGIYGEVS